MSDEESVDHAESDDTTAIGVGMGGSCPTCRSPIELGQEFCLECGAPIRFSARMRRQQRASGGATRTTTTTAAATPPKAGFPWVPFLVVVGLVGLAIAFALNSEGSASRNESADESTEPALPRLTNETDGSGAGETVTVASCDDITNDTIPAVDENTDATGEEIPSFEDDLADTDDTGEFGVPSTTPDDDGVSDSSTDDSTEPTVTVDENGNLCPTVESDDSSDPFATDSDDPFADESDPFASPGTGGDGSSTGTNPGGGPTGSDQGGTGTGQGTGTGSGDWPSGTSGWTVIVFGYPDDRQRATQSAADVQEDGYSDVGVLDSSRYPTLCPGFWVVYSGVFDTAKQAQERRDELSTKGYLGMTVREVSETGEQRTGCQPVGERN